ncbi:MAG: RNA polymerase sigma factor [Myxococcota bacterium]
MAIGRRIPTALGSRAAPAPRSAGRTSAGELDALTLARARKGDAHAFRDLVLAYEGRVFGLVGRILGSSRRAHVEDVAQETFVKVHRGLSSFDPRGSARLSTWILTIATRTAVDLVRREKVTVALPEGLPSEQDIEATAAARVEAHQVERALAKLSPEHRAILALRAFHDLDYSEIAEALDLSVGTVKSRLARARTALRAAVEGDTHAS